MLTEGLLLAVMVLAVVMILRPGTDAAHAEGRRVVCEVIDTDRYGRKVSRCERDGEDVARGLVSAGLALAYRRYSRDYIDEELAAEARGAGAWNGSFDRPEQWRSRDRRY